MRGLRPGREGEWAALLRERLAEIETRVRGMASENRQLRTRVRELEQELSRAREELKELQAAKGRRTEIRGRLERILAELESLKGQDRQEGAEPALQD